MFLYNARCVVFMDVDTQRRPTGQTPRPSTEGPFVLTHRHAWALIGASRGRRNVSGSAPMWLAANLTAGLTSACYGAWRISRSAKWADLEVHWLRSVANHGRRVGAVSKFALCGMVSLTRYGGDRQVNPPEGRIGRQSSINTGGCSSDSCGLKVPSREGR